MSTHTLSVGRRVLAPIASVFDAWLDAELVRSWMKPRPEVTLTEVEIDPVVGGRFRIVMRAHERNETHEGVYRIIDRPNRLSFSWVSAATGGDTTIDVSFLTTTDDTTMVLLKHDGLTDAGSTANHREDWRRILDSLARTLERPA